jgi:hypothetical protein
MWWPSQCFAVLRQPGNVQPRSRMVSRRRSPVVMSRFARPRSIGSLSVPRTAGTMAQSQASLRASAAEIVPPPSSFAVPIPDLSAS